MELARAGTSMKGSVCRLAFLFEVSTRGLNPIVGKPPNNALHLPPILDQSERAILAESGSQNQVFPAFLTSALPPEAVIRMVES